MEDLDRPPRIFRRLGTVVMDTQKGLESSPIDSSPPNFFVVGMLGMKILEP